MEILHKGIDGLDVALQARLEDSLVIELELAKAEADACGSAVVLVRGDKWIKVQGHGKKGGYQFVCETDNEFGATWAFKKPNPNDPWGVHVSFRALPLAMYGLDWARAYIDEILGLLNVLCKPGGESIGRFDVAFDILMHNFILSHDHFVMHSRCHRRTHQDIEEMAISGHSGRTTSVTIGKNPGRQAIMYDKLADTIAKRKLFWFEIWNKTRQNSDMPPLDFTALDGARVWRIELRAFKRYLKDDWQITSWGDLNTYLEEAMHAIMTNIRHCTPTNDPNRARWPASPMWRMANDALSEGIFDYISDVDPSRVKEIILEEKRRQLVVQRHGLTVATAGLLGQTEAGFGAFISDLGREELALASEHRLELGKRLTKAREKYQTADAPRPNSEAP